MNIKYGKAQMIEQNLDILQKYTQNAMKELAQVGAVLMKIENTISEVEK